MPPIFQIENRAPVSKCGSPYMRERKVGKLRRNNSCRSLRLRTERRGNQCSEERAEQGWVENGPVATSDSTISKHFEIGSRKSTIESSFWLPHPLHEVSIQGQNWETTIVEGRRKGIEFPV